MLNIMECSTLGQSNIAVVLMTVGKTFQFIPMQILETSAKFKSMIFVGAFLGHFNCLQVTHTLRFVFCTAKDSPWNALLSISFPEPNAKFSFL